MNGRIKIVLFTLWSSLFLSAAYVYLTSDLSAQTISRVLQQRIAQWGLPGTAALYCDLRLAFPGFLFRDPCWP